MRILLVSDYYPPYIGGAQIQTQLLARELRQRGHQIAVATAWQNALPKFELDDGVEIYRLRQLRTLPGLARKRWQHHPPPFPDPVTTFSLRRLIGRFKPDLVHSYGWMSYAAAAALLGKDGPPLLITARDYGYSCAKRTMMRNGVVCSGPSLGKCIVCAGRHYGQPKGLIASVGVLFGRALLRRKTMGVHSVSTYVREIVRRDFLGELSSNTSGHVIHDVIGSVPTTEDLTQERKADPVPDLPNEPFMVFVGAFRKIKGINELMSAYGMLENPPLLVLIGTMEPDSPLQFPPGVRVLLDVPHDGVMAAAASENCLFGVMPSIFPEPFGTVVCEVMSHGKPVIGTTPGGHTDMIVDGESGLLVPAGDVNALAEAMQLLISNPDVRQRLGEAARERARQFTAEVSIPRLELLYEQMLRQH